MASPILQGMLGGSLILQGYVGAAVTPDTSHVVLQGYGGGLIVTGGYGGTVTPPTADHRTLYAQAVQRKPSAAIDPTKTVATRK